MTSKKPKIGVIPDFNPGSDLSYCTRPHYAIRTNYIEMLSQQNALPVILPYDYNGIDDHVSDLDGLLVIGGFFDIDPLRYNEKHLHPATLLNKTRENFEFQFSEKFLATKKPILGICNGMQAINTIRGGALIQDITDENNNYMIHEQSKIKGKEDSHLAYHTVKIKENTLLHKITGQTEIQTNSSHHQAIRTPGANLKITAHAPDNIIEAIEDPSHPFCLGVQWHPEFEVSPTDRKIFAALVDACR